MNNPNTSWRPESARPQADLVYDAISIVERDRNIAFVAFEQIKGADLAELFLEGYASQLRVTLAEQDNFDADPLETAITNIRYIAGYYITGGEAEKLGESLRPWQIAYQNLTQKQQESS